MATLIIKNLTLQVDAYEMKPPLDEAREVIAAINESLSRLDECPCFSNPEAKDVEIVRDEEDEFVAGELDTDRHP